jgi:hypothetical protein
MSKLTPIYLLALLVLSCGETRVCNYNGTDVPCAYYDLYTQLADIETKINATFEDDAYFTFDEEYRLREQWNALYEAKKDSLKDAYDLMGLGAQFSMMSEMRVEEMNYFKEQKVKRAELQKFLPSLAIKAEKVDTSFWGGDPEPTLMWTVTNNSDKTFASLYIDKNIVVDGKIVKSSSTTYIFVNDQLIPAPKEGEEAHVKPGMSVVLSFDIPQTGEIQPEIAGVGFVEKEGE